MFANTVELISPLGTVNLLFGNKFTTEAIAPGDGVNTLLSNAFWGENPAGTWQLKITNDATYDPNGVSTFELVEFSVTARSGSLIAAEAGDFDANGLVDVNDYLVWKQDFGSTIRLRADDNGDGIVNLADYTIWRDNLGSSTNSTLASSAVVPEPTSAMLCFLASVAFLGGRGPRVAA